MTAPKFTYSIGSISNTEYGTEVKARKAAIESLAKRGFSSSVSGNTAYIYRYSVKVGGWKNIGRLYWPGKSYQVIYTDYKTDDDVEYILRRDGTILTSLDKYMERERRMWSKRYGN